MDHLYRINEGIRSETIRLVGDNVENGIYALDDAITMARGLRLDLVEISGKATPPVCKVIDFSKFKYEQKKKLKEIKAKSKAAPMKEIRFSPDTEDHDFDFKLRHAKDFLADGSKVRIYVHFKGRSIIYKERGEVLLLKFAQELTEHARIDEMPKLEGKRMFLMLSPKGKK